MENAEYLLKSDLEINVLRKDRESRTGQKENLNTDAVLRKASANPMERSGTWVVLHSGPKEGMAYRPFSPAPITR